MKQNFGKAQRRERRRWLKQLAAEKAMSWRLAALHPSLDGLTQLETRHQTLYFQDGVCVRSSSRTGDTSVPCRLLGMRIVGWLTDDDRVLTEHVDGARALLWLATSGDMTVALTAACERFGAVVPLTALTRPIPCISAYAVI